MRIGFDARWIFAHTSGIGCYTRELLLALAPQAGEHELVILFDRPEARDELMAELRERTSSRVTALLVPWGPLAVAGQILLPGRLRAQRLDVFHAPNWGIPLAAFPRSRKGATRCIITFHDLIPLLFPEFTPRARKNLVPGLFPALLRSAAARAHCILTPSEATRRDVLTKLGVSLDEQKVIAIPEGVAARFRPGPPAARRAPVILYVGRMDPYKNVPLLIEAFANILPRVPGTKLRIVGPEDPRYPQARETAARLGLEGHILWEGYLDGPSLLKAYQEAAVLALPSRYEGFGLPVLEAMACGTPVVCGNASSLPEVAGDAALLTPPDDREALARALAEALCDQDVKERLSRCGIERAAAFTWERTARATLQAYEQTVAGELNLS